MASKENQGIRSVEHAFTILETIKNSPEPLTLSDISRLTNMSKSRVQKYIISFLKMDVLQRNENDYTYQFGTKLLDFGLHAIRKYEVVELAGKYLKIIKNELHQTSALNIWTAKGPVVVKTETSGEPISIDIQVGYRPPLLRSATGKCFVAFMETAEIKKMMQNEIKQYNLDSKSIEKELDKIRKNGFSFRDSTEEGVPGGVAITCPVFSSSGNIVAAISIIGFHDNLDISSDSKEVKKLKEITLSLSKELRE